MERIFRLSLRSNRHLGDAVILTGAVRNVKAVHPDVRLAPPAGQEEIWENNPDVEITGEDVPELPAIEYGVASELTGARGNVVEGFTAALCGALGVPVCGFTTRTPVLFLSEQEKAEAARWNGKWLVNANCQTCSRSKMYPHWQKVVDMLPGIEFVQIGGNEGRDISIDLNRVLNWRGRSSARDLFVMAFGCAGVASPPSAITSIAAAFGKPNVVVNGSREPDMLTDYPNTVHVSHRHRCGWGVSTGCISLHIGFGNRLCTLPDGEVSSCMSEIEPEQVANAIAGLAGDCSDGSSGSPQ